MEPVQIQIAQISKTQQPSKYKPGETYTAVKIKSADGVVYSTSGKWSEDWKEGDTITAIVDKVERLGSDGFPVTYLNLKNPNPSTGNSQFRKRNFWPDAYRLALDVIVHQVDESTLDSIATKLKAKLDRD